MKPCYLFDPTTGLLLSESVAFASPAEPGNYLIPNDATFIAPPTSLAANEAAVFTAGAWTVVSDYRGQVLYDQISGASLTVDTLGALPAGYGTSKPAALLATEAKAARIAQIKTELAALDARKIRPIADGDAAYLATLNSQSVTLRAELLTLTTVI